MRSKFLLQFQTLHLLFLIALGVIEGLMASDCRRSLSQMSGSFSEESIEIVSLQPKADQVFPEMKAMRKHLQESGEEYQLRESEFGMEFQILPSKTHLGRIAKWLKDRFGAEIIYAPFALGHEEMSFTLNRSIFISHREFESLQVDETFDHEIQHLLLNIEVENIEDLEQSVLTTRFFDVPGSQSGRFSAGVSEVLVIARDVRRRMHDLLLHTKNFKSEEEILNSPVFLKLERQLDDKILDLKEVTGSFKEALESMQSGLRSSLLEMKKPTLFKATKSEEGNLKFRYRGEGFSLALRLMRENKTTWISAEMKTPSLSNQPASIILVQWRLLTESFFEMALENPSLALEKFQSLIHERLRELFEILNLAESIKEAAARALWTTRSGELNALSDFLSAFPNEFSVKNQESIDQMMDVFLEKSMMSAPRPGQTSLGPTDLRATYDHVSYWSSKEPNRFAVSEDLNLAVDLSLRGVSKILLLSRNKKEIESFRKYLILANEDLDFEKFLQAIRNDPEARKIFERHGEKGYQQWQKAAQSEEIRSLFLSEDSNEWEKPLGMILNQTSPSVVLLKADINDETDFSLSLKKHLISVCFEERNERSGAFMSQVFVPTSREDGLFYQSQPAFYFLANDLRFEDQMKRKGAFDFFSSSDESRASNLDAFRGRFITILSKETQEELGSGFLVFDSEGPYLKLRTEGGVLERVFYNAETSELSVISPPMSLQHFFSFETGSLVKVKSHRSGHEYEVYLDQILDIQPTNDSVKLVWKVRLMSGEDTTLYFDPHQHEILSR